MVNWDSTVPCGSTMHSGFSNSDDDPRRSSLQGPSLEDPIGSSNSGGRSGVSRLASSLNVTLLVEASKKSQCRICSRLSSARSANWTPAVLSKSRVHLISPAAWKELLMTSPPKEAGIQPIASSAKLMRSPSAGRSSNSKHIPLSFMFISLPQLVSPKNARTTHLIGSLGQQRRFPVMPFSFLTIVTGVDMIQFALWQPHLTCTFAAHAPSGLSVRQDMPAFRTRSPGISNSPALNPAVHPRHSEDRVDDGWPHQRGQTPRRLTVFPSRILSACRHTQGHLRVATQRVV